MAEASDLKFGKELRFAKFSYKITPTDKSGRGCRLRSFKIFGGSPLIFLQWLKLAISNLVHSLGLPSKPIIKIT